MEPEYGKYNLEELTDVYNNMDRTANPERYELVKELLEEKLASATTVQNDKHDNIDFRVNEKISGYKLISLLCSIACIGLFVYVLSSDDLSMGVKIAAGMFACILVYAVHSIYLSKVASLCCPKCGKPIMTKSEFPDDGLLIEAYDECYFCGHKFG